MSEKVMKINENGEFEFEGNKYRIDIIDHEFDSSCEPSMILINREPIIQLYKNGKEYSALYINDFRCIATSGDVPLNCNRLVDNPVMKFDFFRSMIKHWLGYTHVHDTSKWLEKLYRKWIRLTVIDIDAWGSFKFRGHQWRIGVKKRYTEFEELKTIILYKNERQMASFDVKIKEDMSPTDAYNDFKETLNYYIENVWFYRQVFVIGAHEGWYQEMYKKSCKPKVNIYENGAFNIKRHCYYLDVKFNCDATHKILSITSEGRQFASVSDADLKCCEISYSEFKDVVNRLISGHLDQTCEGEFSGIEAPEKMYEILYKKWTHMIID